MRNNNNLTRWTYQITAATLLIVNAALTITFGFSYLGAAFGTVGIVRDFLGAFYALLIFDVLFLAWFWVYLSMATSAKQRTVSLTLAVVALIGSTMATVQQLTVNATGLVNLAQYHDAVGMVAMFVMIGVTVAHIAGFAAFVLFDPDEQERQIDIDNTAHQLDLNAKMKMQVCKERAAIHDQTIREVIPELRRRMNQIKPEIVSRMTDDIRAEILQSLGFTPDGQQIGRLTSANAPPPDKFDIDVAAAHFQEEAEEPPAQPEPEASPAEPQPVNTNTRSIEHPSSNHNGAHDVNF